MRDLSSYVSRSDMAQQANSDPSKKLIIQTKTFLKCNGILKLVQT